MITIGSAGKFLGITYRLDPRFLTHHRLVSSGPGFTRPGTPLLEQLACSWLFENDRAWLPARRAMLAARRDMCGALMTEYFPHWRFTSPEGGLSFWVELPGMLATLFSARAESIGIHIGTGTRFGLAGAFDRYLRLPFTRTMRSCATHLRPCSQSGRVLRSRMKIRECVK